MNEPDGAWTPSPHGDNAAGFLPARWEIVGSSPDKVHGALPSQAATRYAESARFYPIKRQEGSGVGGDGIVHFAQPPWRDGIFTAMEVR